MSLALCALLFGSLVHAAPACQLKFSWSDDPPYLMREGQGPVAGITAEVVEASLKRMNCTVTWIEMPWARALLEIEGGRLDGAANLVRRPEREVYALFAQPQFRSRVLLFAGAPGQKLAAAAADLRSLMAQHFRLGAQIGWSYSAEFNAMAMHPEFARQITKASTRQSLWAMLQLDRLDGVLADEVTGQYELMRLGLSAQVRALPFEVTSEPWGVAVSKLRHGRDWVERYDRASEAVRLDGTQERITRRYLGAAR